MIISIGQAFYPLGTFPVTTRKEFVKMAESSIFECADADRYIGILDQVARDIITESTLDFNPPESFSIFLPTESSFFLGLSFLNTGLLNAVLSRVEDDYLSSPDAKKRADGRYMSVLAILKGMSFGCRLSDDNRRILGMFSFAMPSIFHQLQIRTAFSEYKSQTPWVFEDFLARDQAVASSRNG